MRHKNRFHISYTYQGYQGGSGHGTVTFKSKKRILTEADFKEIKDYVMDDKDAHVVLIQNVIPVRRR
ncbi:hypothetical protein [Alkalicoccobacillus gibsonii]|uniref:hypothetical protein n=1 Tax=Alkalicoccobacillus gibsonii TaxID=79881 RepID=UPI0035178347